LWVNAKKFVEFAEQIPSVNITGQAMQGSI